VIIKERADAFVRRIIVINPKHAKLEYASILQFALKEDHPAYVE